MPNISNT